MIKVFQTIINAGHGNCMQAAMASLFELKLEEVPNFKEEESWFGSMYKFVREHGYDFDGTLYNRKNGLWNGTILKGYEDRFEEIKNMEGINGYFYAVVYSPKYYKLAEHPKDSVTHAVIIDKDFNIIHDPNPENQELKKYPYADEIGYNGIADIFMINPIK